MKGTKLAVIAIEIERGNTEKTRKVITFLFKLDCESNLITLAVIIGSITKIMAPNHIDLNNFELHIQIMYAALMAELQPSKKLYQLKLVLSSSLSPSGYLNKKIIDILIEQQLIKYKDHSHTTFTLMIKNTDKNLTYLLEIIKNANISDEGNEYNLEWIKNLLIAECVRHMSHLLERKGITICTDIEPPLILNKLISARSINEMKMLCWQVATNINQRDLRLIKLNSEECVLKNLFNEVDIYHQNYLRTERVVSIFIEHKKLKHSSMTKIFSQYLLRITTNEFELATSSELEIKLKKL